MPEPLRCPGCGAVLSDKALLAACKDCLNRRYADALFGREAGYLAAQADPGLVVVSQGLRRHLVMAVDQTRTYCGTRVIAPPFKKLPFKVAALPAGLCKECAKKLDEITASAKGATT